VKVGVWCAVSARRIVGPVMFFNETINCERYVQVILGQLFSELTDEERLYGWFQQDSATAHTARTCMSMQALSDVLGAELSVVVFGQHVHSMLILEFLFLGLFEGRLQQ
jgi:hypothetical protein